MNDIRMFLMKLIANGIYTEQEVTATVYRESCITFRHFVNVFLFLIFNLSNDLLEQAIDVIMCENAFFGEKLWAEYFIIRGLQSELEECQFIYE